MKIVIDIPENYLHIQSILVSQMVIDKVWDAVKEGTPLDDIKAEIMGQFEGCDICRWFEDYDYEENNISEYQYVGSIDDILEIMDKHIRKERK